MCCTTPPNPNCWHHCHLPWPLLNLHSLNPWHRLGAFLGWAEQACLVFPAVDVNLFCLNNHSKIFQKRRIFKLLLEATHVGYPWNQFRESNISHFVLCQNSCTCTCIYTSARYPFPTQFLGTCSVKPQKSVGLNSHRRGEWCRTRVFLGNLSPSMDR